MVWNGDGYRQNEEARWRLESKGLGFVGRGLPMPGTDIGKAFPREKVERACAGCPQHFVYAIPTIVKLTDNSGMYISHTTAYA